MNYLQSIYNYDIVHLFVITSLVCGLEFCTASAFTYIPPILLKAGISESSMTWLMGCGPLLGFLLCPVVGHSSDRCRSRFGKRRPFILGFCTTIIFCLILIPQSEAIGTLFHSPKLGLCLLVITCVLFDFSAQACFNPCESLIYDVCKGTPQENSCFFVYSFMTSFGGCLGYLITATDWTDSFLSNYLQGQEKLAFAVILLFFSITLCFTLISANEKIYDYLDEQIQPTDTSILDYLFPLKFVKNAFSTVSNSVKTIFTMPFVLRRLTLAECCSWSAIMTFNLFFTDFVGQTVYKGDPGADELSIERIRYDQGVRAASYGLLFHCIVGALYAPLLKPLINQFGIHLVFSFGMLVFALSMLVIYASTNIIVVNIMASLSGLGMASLTSIPYTLVMTYHANREIYFADNPVIQTRGIGTILGILDSTYFASQIISSLIMGYIMLIFKSTLSYIVTSFVLALCSLWFINRIVINRHQLQELIRLDK
ncbi:unnamed protein product [Rotaria magnacalcarata]|uniref:Solute carrier family 45 member 3 n=5 Tax=Rotaria magnacalcarata TaxID=392030 RepID=A0A816KMR2_9BILA|nr:unnamed protein product [Rotaria magnacalcarata]CAF1393244.1 unnamed protein product [Rotaria magnacalcarata]CAF1923021.1 unnamed protein product [Rotaria magnacalcarata]CAF1932419.1 unnamed protein product [Rotaria magnacalcarata]CAF1963222.1 unnamed protein product [Rotaria magnacalcarata]